MSQHHERARFTPEPLWQIWTSASGRPASLHETPSRVRRVSEDHRPPGQHPASSVSALLLSCILVVIGCTQVRQLNRFFLTRCPEEGPRPEQEFDIHLEPVDLQQYYDDLLSSAGAVPRRTLADVPEHGAVHPIYHFGPIGAAGGTSILIIAGVHGNELAGVLAAPRILEDISSRPGDYEGVRVHVVAPANPVGLEYGSRYNPQGCDINRDFRAFDTVESRAIRDVLRDVAPRLILSLHEGPHDGFFVIATRSLPGEVAQAAVGAIPGTVLPLASENNFGLSLRTPGVMREGWFVTSAKTLFGITSLGAYGEAHGVPTLTTEGPWSSHDLSARIEAQVLAVRGVARHFEPGP